jgi:hypothetical protein
MRGVATFLVLVHHALRIADAPYPEAVAPGGELVCLRRPGSQVGPLLDQISGPVASFTADSAHAQDDVHSEVGARHPGAAAIVPPQSSAATDCALARMRAKQTKWPLQSAC